MTPVELRLQNFLSYGEAAPPLDFEAFQTACISGGNGQGKSSLLDALTWALWGQARKGTSAIKPDADLLRKGALRMVVELVFDHDGQRYRVRRGYGTSKSGKTPKPDLEAFAADGADWRTLTSTSVAETQRVLDRILRIDYDTFVNASMLLQGRADEFTRKKPNERKEVLARILGLDRYEVLERRAAGRLSTAKATREAAERERERLAAIADTRADVDAAHAAAVEAETAALATRDAARASLDAARLALSAASADARRLDDLRASAARASAEIARLAAERADYAERLARVDAEIARAAETEDEHVRFLALDADVRRLSDLAAQHHALERQAMTVEQGIAEARHEAERRLGALDADIRSAHEQSAAADARASGLASVDAALASARTSASAGQALDAARARAEALDATRAEIEAAILAARRALEVDRDALARRLPDLRQRAERHAEAARKADALATATAERAEAEALRDRLQDDGRRAADERSASAAERDRAVAERDDARALAERLRRAGGNEPCPACGGALTAARRAALVRENDARADDLDRRAAAATERHDAATRQRTELLDRHKAAVAAIDAARQRENEWQRLHIEVQESASAGADLMRAEGEIAILTRRIDEKDYAAEARAERAAVVAERAGLAYDAAEHDRLRRDAAREGDLMLRRQGIVDAARSAAELRARADALTARRDAARRDLDAGLPFGDAPARLDRVRDQIRALGFDGAAFERTRASRDALAGAPARRERLLAAREARADLATDAARAAERHSTLTTEHAALAVRIADLARLDDARRAGESAVADATTAATAADAALDTHRHETARASAARDAVASAEAAHRAAVKAATAARADEALYKHLREAFSRRGIPSLIIEDALPEIETRANDLLDRLSDGRMRVAFETQRNRKSDDGTIETLEVKVADESGQLRSYETFSGGEAFRVNFALRVALSQMLAARSGVTVRTLVIDEGFGTQDQAGVRLLIEAINSVREDFDKILVITHLDEMKEAFPVRIEVRKDPVTGSTFEVIGA